MVKNNFLYTVITVLLICGCGQKNQSQDIKQNSGDSKSVKSDSSLAGTNETDNIKISGLPKFKIAFEREESVHIVNSDLTGEKLLFKSFDNLISPDGSKIVSSKNNQDGSRSIAVYDIQSNATKILSSIKGKQNFDASFSPDGKSLVFCNFSGVKWNLAIINLDDTGFKVITEDYKSDLFCPTFSPDGNSILCQDMQNFLEIDLKGKIITSIPLKDIIGDKKIYLSSGNKGYWINNKSAILFDADTEDFFETMREPISGVFVYDIKTKSLKSLSTKNISMYHPYPVNDGKYILFSAYTKEDLVKSPDPQDNEPVITSWIYIMNLDGTGKTKMIKNAFEPSASQIN